MDSKRVNAFAFVMVIVMCAFSIFIGIFCVILFVFFVLFFSQKKQKMVVMNCQKLYSKSIVN